MFKFPRKKVTDEVCPPAPKVQEAEVNNLLNEACLKINEMLEIGATATIFSDIDYEGFIIVVPDARPPFGRCKEYGFLIEMHSVSNLSDCRYKYPQLRQKPENWDMFFELERFAERNNEFYDVTEEGYIYRTKNTVCLKKEQNPRDLEGRLMAAVKENCPLADFSGAPIHTKNVAH